MKLTESQKKVLNAFKETGLEWGTWPELGLTGAAQNAMDALVRKGILEQRKGACIYRVVNNGSN